MLVSASRPYDFLSSVYSNSSALRHHHRVTPRREVAGFLLVNLVSDSLNHIRMVVKSICFMITHEHESFMNSSSMSDFKSLSSCFWTCQIWLATGTYLRRRSGPPRSYGRPSYRADKSHDVYPSNAGGFLSLPPDMCRSICGIG